MVLYENMLYVEVMYHFNEQVDFKISSKLIQASKGLNNILLIISQSHLSIAQASSSFKCLDKHTFTYATPTLITKALQLIT